MNAEEFPVVLFSSQDGDVRVNAVLRDKTLWLTQKSMADLFGAKSQTITKYLKNIYAALDNFAALCEQILLDASRRQRSPCLGISQETPDSFGSNTRTGV